MTRLPLLLHPLTFSALVVLITNDHVFKYSNPGVVTGKASDFAGLVLLPMLIIGVLELLGAKRLRMPALFVCCTVGIAFAASKLLPAANEPAEALLGGQVLMDPWDLIALTTLIAP